MASEELTVKQIDNGDGTKFICDGKRWYYKSAEMEFYVPATTRDVLETLFVERELREKAETENGRCREVLRYLKAAKLGVPEWVIEKLDAALAEEKS
jgi:hypothetical protein